MNESKSSQGKHFHSATKNIISNVIKFCENEADRGCLTILLSHGTKRAASIAGVSESTVKRIRKENSNNDSAVFVSPKKRKGKTTIENANLDSFDLNVIRRTVQDFYISEKKVPTIPKLLLKLKENISFSKGRETLRKVLHEIGFRWKNCKNKRKILMERNDIVLARTKYLRSIHQFRKEKRPLIFIDETWIDSNLTVGKCWQSEDIFGVVKTGAASRRIIALCAGGEMGFIPNLSLVYKANTTTGDYHGQMNSVIFEKWAKEKLIPNLPKDAVVVIDNAPYHSVQINKPPTFSQNKKVITDWLNFNQISYSPDMRKVELIELVKRNSPPIKTYKFDAMLAEHGYLVLRLPPYHCDINAIEYVWADIKNFIRQKNITADINMEQLFNFTELALQNVTVEKWMKYCKHVEKLENEYWQKDGLIDEICDPLIVSLNDDDDDDDFELSSDDSFLEDE